jgi:hypothetical protein
VDETVGVDTDGRAHREILPGRHLGHRDHPEEAVYLPARLIAADEYDTDTDSDTDSDTGTRRRQPTRLQVGRYTKCGGGRTVVARGGVVHEDSSRR